MLLTGGVVVVVLSALAGSASVVLLLARRDSQARLAATAAVLAVLIGWGFAQYPWVLVDELQLEDAAGARPTLIGLVVVGGLATVMVVPSLVWLFRLVHQDSWSEPPPDARRAGGW
ncbi:MAG: putative cytochrome bd-I oxidase subunit II [Acidimicrobiaceae bacterium]|nr:MAG: putative cytochrome bd-I oxidase subunit II [Acidimicrobiaceae bacterium]